MSERIKKGEKIASGLLLSPFLISCMRKPES